MAHLSFDLIGHGRSDTVGPGGSVHGLEGLLHDGAVRDENENVLLLCNGVQAVAQCLLQQGRILIEHRQKGGFSTKGQVNVAGPCAHQMGLALESGARDGTRFLLGQARHSHLSDDLVGYVLKLDKNVHITNN